MFIKVDNDVELTLLNKVEEVVEWRKDRLWGKNDGGVRLVEKHIEIQNILHS